MEEWQRRILYTHDGRSPSGYFLRPGDSFCASERDHHHVPVAHESSQIFRRSDSQANTTDYIYVRSLGHPFPPACRSHSPSPRATPRQPAASMGSSDESIEKRSVDHEVVDSYDADVAAQLVAGKDGVVDPAEAKRVR